MEESSGDQPKSPPSKILLLLSVLLVFSVGLNLSQFLNPEKKLNYSRGSNSKDKGQATELAKEEKTNSSWQKPDSKEQGFPIPTKETKPNTRRFLIYSLSKDKTLPVDYNVQGAGGAMGYGETSPLASPDLLYTVFINEEDKNLWLLSNETLQAKRITDFGGVSYISGWSKDSKKIIFNIGADSITSQTQGMGGYPETKIQFKTNLNPGYFIFNIETGELKKLYPIESFEAFIDNERILTRATDQGSKDRLIVFNTNTFEADYGFVKDKFGFGNLQFNFTNNGEKWTFTASKNPTNDAYIVYADFPSKEGETVDSGQWADVQFPILSPDGNKISYSRKEGYISSGIPKQVAWVYDVKNKTKKGYIEGWPKVWINNHSLIVFNDSYYILNTETGESKKIY